MSRPGHAAAPTTTAAVPSPRVRQAAPLPPTGAAPSAPRPGRRSRAALLLLALALAVPPGLALAQAGWVQLPVAELQALDKVSARVSVIPVPVGQTVRFGTLAITVRACHIRPREEVPDAAAWIEVRDERAGAQTPLAFQGWMFAAAPGVNLLEHPVYDLRVLNCR